MHMNLWGGCHSPDHPRLILGGGSLPKQGAGLRGPAASQSSCTCARCLVPSSSIALLADFSGSGTLPLRPAFGRSFPWEPRMFWAGSGLPTFGGGPRKGSGRLSPQENRRFRAVSGARGSPGFRAPKRLGTVSPIGKSQAWGQFWHVPGGSLQRKLYLAP